MKHLALSAVLLAAAGSAFAAGAGDHRHGDMPAGQPGDTSAIDRVIEIRMVETEDGMGYEPAAFEVEAGETIRLAVTNAGVLPHEIVLGTKASNRAHQEEMAGMADMAHDDPNALQLAPGESGEIVWTFTDEGTFQFACLIPGHMEAGMHGPITVN